MVWPPMDNPHLKFLAKFLHHLSNEFASLSDWITVGGPSLMNKAFKREYTSSADFVFKGNSQQNFEKTALYRKKHSSNPIYYPT